jgi:hypothetical protein
MPTPSTGAISMLDMRNEITRGAGAISMSEVRTRYGGSGAISFNDLRNSEGFIITCGTYSDKFGSFDGWSKITSTGSVNPNESNGTVQFAANSFLWEGTSSPAGSSDGRFGIYDSNSTLGSNVTVGFRGFDVTRAVTANTSRTITNSSTTSVDFDYGFPASGTVHCLIKF